MTRSTPHASDGVPSLREASLLLLGHGSTLNADSSTPTYRHAEEIRRRNIFGEVRVGFWKEEPNFRQALRQTRGAQVYVVPNFISSGYFTEQVIPRELGLRGPVTQVGAQRVGYCAPVGLHPAMTDALLAAAREVVALSGATIADPARTACLFICGHGTSLNDNSTKIIHERAAEIRARGLFADCQGVLMEQAPFVKDWRTLTDCPDVIVVPFFISDGLHSYEDIPVLLGLTHNVHEAAFANPHVEPGRRLWYANAIGTAPFLADVIVTQVEQFRLEHGVEMAGGTADAAASAQFGFPATSNGASWNIGQVLIERGCELRHREDAGRDDLRELASLAEIRDLVRLDEAENFRPLPAAPTLRRGWRYRAPNSEALRDALDYLYPAELANAALWQDEKLTATPWHETAERQSGRFRVVRDLDDAEVVELIAQVCEHSCLKRRVWSPAAQTVAPAADDVPLLCPEACNYFVGRVREKLKGADEGKD
jgi:sirohydrochlorin cobaltochelatase